MKLVHWILGIPNRRFIAFVLAFYLLLALPLLTLWPPPMVDEALFGSTAKSLLEKGILGTPLVQGLESHVYWQPPVYFLTLVPVIKVGGYCLATLRVFSVLVACAIVFVVFALGLRLTDPVIAKVASVVLVCDPKFVNTAMYGRMDGLCVLFMLVSLALFAAPVFRSKSVNTLAVGLTAALASLTHPLGTIAPMVLIIYVMGQATVTIRDRIKTVVLILLPFCVGMSLWGMYVLQDSGSFIHQIGFQLSRKDRPIASTVMSVIRHYHLYPLSLAIPCLALGISVVSEIRGRSNLAVVVLFQALVMVIVVAKFEIPYHVYFAPMGALMAAVLLVRFWKKSRSWGRILAGSFGCGILLNAMLVVGYLNFIHHYILEHETDYDEFSRNISGYLPSGARVFGRGSPFLYWGLYAQRPDIQLRDLVALDSVVMNQAARETDYVVFTRAFQPDEDRVTLSQWTDSFSRLFSENGRKLQLVGAVGTVRRFAYSAEIFEAIPRRTKL